jgi:predicted DNA-binding protein with PD1-like motif
MKSFELKVRKLFVGRLEKGDDVLAALTGFCKKNGVTSGVVRAIGAVERGGVGYYDQQRGEYLENRFHEGMEIVSLQGNISLKEGDVFLHCHAVLADREGRCYGGHLLEGNIAFACEFAVTAFDGPPPQRSKDPETGLMLW